MALHNGKDSGADRLGSGSAITKRPEFTIADVQRNGYTLAIGRALLGKIGQGGLHPEDARNYLSIFERELPPVHEDAPDLGGVLEGLPPSEYKLWLMDPKTEPCPVEALTSYLIERNSEEVHPVPEPPVGDTHHGPGRDFVPAMTRTYVPFGQNL